MNGYRRHDNRVSPASPGWWGRLFVGVWFIFCVHYVPIHLASEPHLTDQSHLRADAAEVFSTNVSFEHPDAGEDHTPHFAADHLFRLAPQTASQVACIDLVVAGKEAASFTPQLRQRLFLTERQNPPGPSAPSPAQPRAPPAV